MKITPNSHKNESGVIQLMMIESIRQIWVKILKIQIGIMNPLTYPFLVLLQSEQSFILVSSVSRKFAIQ